MDDGKIFVARCYGKSELAEMYFPALGKDAAVQKLKRWIRKCSPLMQEMEAEGHGRLPFYKYFTPREVRLIAKHLGEPF